MTPPHWGVYLGVSFILLTMTFDSLYQRFVDDSLRFDEPSPHTVDDFTLQISSCVDHMYHQGLDPHDLPTDTRVMGLYTPDEFTFLVTYVSDLVDESLECF